MPAAAQGLPSLENLSQDKGVDLEVFQCSACGLVQLNNAPVSYYRDVIRATAYSNEMRQFRVIQFQQWAEKYQLLGRKVLEVGCGKGEYLSLLKLVGLQAYGIEHAIESVESCRAQGLDVVQGYLGEKEGSLALGHQFDAFVCLNFMEHWPQPNDSLRDISEHLAEGAIGLIEVPNFDMILEKGLFSEFIADHLLYFTQKTLSLTLQNNGFDVIECVPIWQNYILSAVVQKRKTISLAFFEKFKVSITEQLNQYISRFSALKVAVWGAGHQALAVIALAGLAKKIAYVIDSAPFKQGKYTPASHLPIVAPNQLNVQSVDAVIIMAASYSDEVARIIQSEYKLNIKVAILRDHGLEEINGY